MHALQSPDVRRSAGEPQAEVQPGDEAPAVHALRSPDGQRSAGEPQFEVQPGDEAPAVHAPRSPDVQQASQLSAWRPYSRSSE